MSSASFLAAASLSSASFLAAASAASSAFLASAASSASIASRSSDSSAFSPSGSRSRRSSSTLPLLAVADVQPRSNCKRVVPSTICSLVTRISSPIVNLSGCAFGESSAAPVRMTPGANARYRVPSAPPASDSSEADSESDAESDAASDAASEPVSEPESEPASEPLSDPASEPLSEPEPSSSGASSFSTRSLPLLAVCDVQPPSNFSRTAPSTV